MPLSEDFKQRLDARISNEIGIPIGFDDKARNMCRACVQHAIHILDEMVTAQDIEEKQDGEEQTS